MLSEDNKLIRTRKTGYKPIIKRKSKIKKQNLDNYLFNNDLDKKNEILINNTINLHSLQK